MSFSTHSQVQCPVCHQPYTAQLEQIIDVGSDPDAKERLLSGQINASTCPRCGATGVLNTPILYHDPAHELLLVHLPMELNIPQAQREQLIGGLTRTLMSRIPAEARKGYLFDPQAVLTLESLIERILEADGIPKEVLEAQKKRNQILTRMLVSSEAEFPEIVKSFDDDIDEQLFQMLASVIDMARRAKRDDEVQRLVHLRNRLLGLSSWGRQQGITPEMMDDQQAGMDLLEEFLAAEEAKWPLLAQQHDDQLDYLFFQLLTAVAESSAGEVKARLLTLRLQLLDHSSMGQDIKSGERVVEELKLAAESAGGLTRELLLDRILQASGDTEMEALAFAGSPILDYSFFILLADEIDSAQKTGDRQEVERLSTLREKLLNLVDALDKARSEWVAQVKAQVDELLESEDQEEAIRHLLPEINEGLLSILIERIETARRAGQKTDAEELSRLLERIMAQIRANTPAEIRLINDLLGVKDETALQEALDARREELSASLVEVMERVHQDLIQRGRDALANRMATILKLANERLS